MKHSNPKGDDPYHDKKVLESDLTVQQVAEVFGAEDMPLRKLEVGLDYKVNTPKGAAKCYLGKI